MSTLSLFSALSIPPLVQGYWEDRVLLTHLHPPSNLKSPTPTLMQIRTPYLGSIIMGWLHSIGIKYVPPIPPTPEAACTDCRGRSPRVSIKLSLSSAWNCFTELFRCSKLPWSTSKNQYKPQRTNIYLKVPKSTSTYPKVPQSTPKYLKVPKSASKYPKEPQSYSNYPKVPQSTKNNLKVPKSTSKYPKVPQSTQKYLKVPKITSKYAKVPQSTQKYLELPKCT